MLSEDYLIQSGTKDANAQLMGGRRSHDFPLGITAALLTLAAVLALGACQSGVLQGRSGPGPSTDPDHIAESDVPGIPDKARIDSSGRVPSAGLIPVPETSDRMVHTSGEVTTDPYPDHYKEPGVVFGRSYSLDPLGTEFVDNYSGRLRLRYTDLKLPGQGPTIVITRTYHNPTTLEGLLGQPILKTRKAGGIGWDIHFGRVHRTLLFSSLCKTGQVTANTNPILELPDGSRKTLFDADEGAPHDYITKDRWRAVCVRGHHRVGSQEYEDGGLLVTSPDGTKYTMDWKGRVAFGDTHHTWSVTKIEDRHGNTLTFTYLDRKTHALTLLDKITANDGRTLQFSYNTPPSGGPKSNTPLLTEISSGDGSQVWRYTYEAAGVADFFHLKEVNGPEGLRWGYTYHRPGEPGSVNGHSVHEVTNPFGGTTSYEYQQVKTTPHTTPIGLQGIRQKTVSGRGVQQGIWNYSFFRTPPTVSDMDFTEVVGPTTRVLYEHCSLREIVKVGPKYCVGRQGQLLSKETYKRIPDGDYSLAQPTQRETYEWALLEVAKQREPLKGTGISEDIEAAFQSLLTQKTIFRDGEYYTVSYYGEDDYGNPRAKIEYRTSLPPPRACLADEDFDCAPGNNDCDYCSVAMDSNRRDSHMSYHVDTSRWIVKQLKDETLYDVCRTLVAESPKPAFCGSSNTFSSGTVRVFDSKSNLKEIYPLGSSDKTLYTYHDHGGVHTKTDPRGHTTTLTQYHRGIPQLERHPEGVTIRRVVNDQGNISAQTDGEKKETRYSYDNLHRLKSITTPRDDDDDVSVTWDWRDSSASSYATRTVVRGGLVDKRVYDGFGREVERRVDTVTLKKKYDADGRKIGLP